MFGLWYLSLALDELRKYLGWSSFFDAFKGNESVENKAIEDKKSTINNGTDNKSQVPEIPKTITKPSPEPPKPVAAVEPSKPKLEPIKPAPAPPKPAPIVEPPKPTIEIPKSPAPELPKPSSPAPVSTPQKPSTPPKPSTPTKQITPPVTPPVEILKKESSPQPKPQTPSPSVVAPLPKIDTNNIDRNLFQPTNKLENGDTSAKSNIKDATTSFLQEEGGKQGPRPQPQQQQPQLSNVNFKQL